MLFFVVPVVARRSAWYNKERLIHLLQRIFFRAIACTQHRKEWERSTLFNSIRSYSKSARRRFKGVLKNPNWRTSRSNLSGEGRRMTAIPSAAHTLHAERDYAGALAFISSVLLARTCPTHKVPYQLALKSSTKLLKAHL